METLNDAIRRGATLEELESLNYPATPDNLGETPLHTAVMSGRPEIVKLLVEQGINVNAQNREGIASIHYAALLNQINVVNYLIQNRANINIQDNLGQTPLEYAVGNNYIDMVQLLVQRGANIHIRDNLGQTLLHHAVIENNINMVNLLLSLNIDPSIRTTDDDAETAYEIAVRNHYNAIAQRLAIQLPPNIHFTDSALITTPFWKNYNEVDQDCAICLIELNKEPVCFNTNCQHGYHCRCITSWLQTGHNTCPVCRQLVVLAELTPLQLQEKQRQLTGFGSFSEIKYLQKIIKQ